MTLHTYNPNQSSHQHLHLMVSEIQPNQVHYSKVKSRSHCHVAYLHPPTNVPSNYQQPTPHNFGDRAGQAFPHCPPKLPPWHRASHPDGRVKTIPT